MTWFQYSVKVCAWLFAIAAVVWLGVAGLCFGVVSIVSFLTFRRFRNRAEAA